MKIEITKDSTIHLGDEICAVVKTRCFDRFGREKDTWKTIVKIITVCELKASLSKDGSCQWTVCGCTQQETPQQYIEDIPLEQCFATWKEAASCWAETFKTSENASV